MTKFEMIEEIRSLNSTASVEFLSQFDEYELQEYIDHLHQVDKEQLTASSNTVVPFN
ncbi:MAG: hypothetical protein JW745_08180 [Sedimentisphaerales bacterium]|nr:hypothetical protein [Sedimentisphaerales bacterium]